MDLRSVVEVFTNKSKEFMLEHGGSASWVLNLKRESSLEYCICCRNDDRPREDDRGERGERRNEAFLVGKISSIEFVENQNNRDRYLIRFSEYAEVSVPDFRHGNTRNPVVFSDVDACRSRGLDISALEFRPMPEPVTPYERRKPGDSMTAGRGLRSGLSIAEAKEGLAISLGVPVEAIHITIQA